MRVNVRMTRQDYMRPGRPGNWIPFWLLWVWEAVGCKWVGQHAARRSCINGPFQFQLKWGFCESIKGPLSQPVSISSKIPVPSMYSESFANPNVLFDQLVWSSETAAEVAFDREHLVAHAHQYFVDLWEANTCLNEENNELCSLLVDSWTALSRQQYESLVRGCFGDLWPC